MTYRNNGKFYWSSSLTFEKRKGIFVTPAHCFLLSKATIIYFRFRSKEPKLPITRPQQIAKQTHVQFTTSRVFLFCMMTVRPSKKLEYINFVVNYFSHQRWKKLVCVVLIILCMIQPGLILAIETYDNRSNANQRNTKQTNEQDNANQCKTMWCKQCN